MSECFRRASYLVDTDKTDCLHLRHFGAVRVIAEATKPPFPVLNVMMMKCDHVGLG